MENIKKEIKFLMNNSVTICQNNQNIKDLIFMVKYIQE